MLSTSCPCGASVTGATEDDLVSAASAHARGVHQRDVSRERVIAAAVKVEERDAATDLSQAIRAAAAAAAALVAERSNDEAVASAARLIRRGLLASTAKGVEQGAGAPPMSGDLLRTLRGAVPHVARLRKGKHAVPDTKSATTASASTEAAPAPAVAQDPAVDVKAWKDLELERLRAESARAEVANAERLQKAQDAARRAQTMSQVMAANHQASMSVIRNIRA